MQQRFPAKDIYYDILYKCFRLIHPSRRYEWQDEEGKLHTRLGVLVPGKIPTKRLTYLLIYATLSLTINKESQNDRLRYI